jgi:hypothetical protein
MASPLSFLPAAMSAASRITSSTFVKQRIRSTTYVAQSPQVQQGPNIARKNLPQLGEISGEGLNRVVNVQNVFGAVLAIPFPLGQDLLREKACGIRDLQVLRRIEWVSIALAQFHPPRRSQQDIHITELS